MMLPEPMRCCFPGCTEFGGHKHHVTYNPEYTQPLCEKHHKEITHLNGIQSRKYHYVKLTNRFRRWIWFQWLDGKLRPRRTRKAQEWTNEWDESDGSPERSLRSPTDALPSTEVKKKQKRRKRKKVGVTRRPKSRHAKKKTKPPRVE